MAVAGTIKLKVELDTSEATAFSNYASTGHRLRAAEDRVAALRDELATAEEAADTARQEHAIARRDFDQLLFVEQPRFDFNSSSIRGDSLFFDPDPRGRS